MIPWLQNNISVLDAINRYGVTMQVARNKLHKAAIEKSLQRDKAPMSKAEPTSKIRSDCSQKWMAAKQLAKYFMV